MLGRGVGGNKQAGLLSPWTSRGTNLPTGKWVCMDPFTMFHSLRTEEPRVDVVSPNLQSISVLPCASTRLPTKIHNSQTQKGTRVSPYLRELLGNQDKHDHTYGNS